MNSLKNFKNSKTIDQKRVADHFRLLLLQYNIWEYVGKHYNGDTKSVTMSLWASYWV